MNSLLYRWCFTILAGLLIVGLGWPVWFAKTDIEYLNHLYDHSQWRIPLSTRIIADSQLYEVAGYRQFLGGDTFAVAPEMPPVGKWLYGWSIATWQTSIPISIFFTCAIIFLSYLLTLLVGGSKKQAWWVSTILLLSPLVYAQAWQSMLDAPQTAAALSYFVFIILGKNSAGKKRQWIYLFLAGASIAAMALFKLPVFVPVILLTTYSWFGKHGWRNSFLLTGVAAITWLAGYWQFFAQGNDIWQLAANQKWIVNQYLQGSVEHIRLMAVTTLVTGLYKGWWAETAFSLVKEYSFYWPVALLAIFAWHQRSEARQWLRVNALLILAICCFIPFWPRYLLLILPILVIELVLWANKKEWLLWMIIILLLVQAVLFLKPQPSNQLAAASYSWRNGNYRDFYQHLQPHTIDLSISEWQQTLKELHISHDVSLTSQLEFETEKFIWPWQNQAEIKIKLSVFTPLGTYEKTTNSTIFRHGNSWQIPWYWQYLHPTQSANSEWQLNLEWPTAGEIIVRNNVVLASNGTVIDVYARPAELTNNKDVITNIATLLQQTYPDLEAQLAIYADGADAIKLGEIVQLENEDTTTLFRNINGIFIKNRFGLAPTSSGKAKEAKHFINAVTNTQPQVMGKVGGKFVIINDQQTSILLENKPENGTTVRYDDVGIEDITQIYAKE